MSLRALSVLALALCVLPACRTARPRTAWTVDAPHADARRGTTSGDVVGGPARYGGFAWLGIPFAAPPVGPLRWRAPRPVAPWSTPKETLAFGPACPQFASPLGGIEPVDGARVGGSEDCLTLNVFGPQAPGDGKRPVMVWIHGGGNSIGTAAFYDGSHLAHSQDVVVVSVQYRLGPFGWLRHTSLRHGVDEVEASGNFGTLDLVAALEWVKANAAAFGGDAGNVTVFGESAGGQDVYTLLLSPRARGLFHRAIVQSGGLSNTSDARAEHFTDDADAGDGNSSNEVLARLLVKDGTAADRAAAKAWLAQTAPERVAAWLRGKSAVEVLEAYGTPGAARVGMVPMPLLFHDGVVLPKGPWHDALAREDGWNRVPVLVGSNRDEMKLFLSVDPHFTWRLFGAVPQVRDEARYQATAEALSHAWKAHGVDSAATAMRRSGAADVYAYRFDWAGLPTVLGSDLKVVVGAAHGLEIPFVFGHFDLGRLGEALYRDDTAPVRAQLSATIMKAWATFARTGQPGTPEAPWSAWDDSTPTAPRYLVLDDAAGGGLRMASETWTMERVIQDVARDARLPADEDKCDVYRRLTAWGWMSREQLATGPGGCPAPAGN